MSSLSPSAHDGAPLPTLAPADSLEGWAQRYILSDRLAHKLHPPPAPSAWASPGLAPQVPDAPGRPSELRVVARAKKAPKRGALKDPRRRAEILHRFFHHELQAAELMLWAMLRFADAPQPLRRGLVQIAHDEIRHANLYLARVRELGADVADFEVRDWFWQRIPACQRVEQFLAVMGMGLEAANLDHAERYHALFLEHGDTQSAALQQLVHEEEVPHVRFAARWLLKLDGDAAEGAPFDDFARWQAELPPPLSPWVMKGAPMACEARTRAGQGAAFLQALAAYEPE